MHQHQNYPQQIHQPPPRKLGRGATWTLAGLGVTIVALVGVLVFVVSGSPGTITPSADTQPHTEDAVKTAAQETFDTYSAGEYGNSWDLWTGAAQKVISRDDYVKVNETCPPPVKGIAFEIMKVQLAADGNSASVRTKRNVPALGSSLATYDFIYEGSGWRWSPEAGTLAMFMPERVKQQLAGNCG